MALSFHRTGDVNLWLDDDEEEDDGDDDMSISIAHVSIH